VPTPSPSPQLIARWTAAPWAAASLQAAVRHGLFAALHTGGARGCTLEAAAEATGVPPRGAQALLDAMVALELVTVTERRYRNTGTATAFLIPDTPAYLGPMVEVHVSRMADWARYPDVVATGGPTGDGHPDADPWWEQLVRGIRPLSLGLARQAADVVGLPAAAASQPDAPLAGLDVGGGLGVYSEVWLPLHPRLTMTQLDWPNVNAAAAAHLATQLPPDAAARFARLDGDMHEVELGGPYDVIVCSHIAHSWSPDVNRGLIARMHDALRPGGTLLIVDFIVDDGRGGPAHALLFNANMVFNNRGGGTWEEREYRDWLSAAGFAQIERHQPGGPASMMAAKRRETE
jgi:SAM-dependent methyltransferase